MKSLICLTFLLNVTVLFGQHWVKVPNSKIMFSNLYDSSITKWEPSQAEYFKKGEKLIVMNGEFSKQFYDLFSETPILFDDILKATYYKTFPKSNLHSYYFDSTILTIKFDTASVVINVTKYETSDEIKWYLWTSDMPNGEFPCKIEIVFEKIKTKPGTIKSKYIRTKNVLCEI